MDRQERIDWSKAPEDATHAAEVDGPNKVCWYKDISETGYCYMYSFGGAMSQWSEGGGASPRHEPLEPRPCSSHMNNEHHDQKEGEGVKWVCGMPPLGCECEYRPDPVCQGTVWIRGVFIGRVNGEDFIDLGGRIDRMKAIDPLRRFRPIQSRRDKVIEAAQEVVSEMRCWQCSREDLEVLYDGGALKLPGDPQ